MLWQPTKDIYGRVPSHCNETMPQRTSPTDALERLSWALNTSTDGPQSLNELAGKASLSWATARKYIQTIETIQKIAPKIAVEKEGVHVGERSRMMEDLFEDPAVALTTYLFVQAKSRNNPSQPMDLDVCSGLDEEFSDTLSQLEDLGWVSISDGEIKLTPKGIQVAGPAHSEINNTDQSLTKRPLRTHQRGSQTVISLEEDVETSGTQRKVAKDRDWDESTRYETDRFPSPASDAIAHS